MQTRLSKTLGILLVVLFVLSVTAASVTAVPISAETKKSGNYAIATKIIREGNTTTVTKTIIIGNNTTVTKTIIEGNNTTATKTIIEGNNTPVTKIIVAGNNTIDEFSLIQLIQQAVDFLVHLQTGTGLKINL